MRTLVIAEAGVNHNGSLKIAKELALVAKECGADIVKFQTAKVDSLVSKKAEMAEYQKKNIGEITSQKEMLSKLLLSYDEFRELSQYCKEIGIKFLSTPFDLESIDFLENLGCDIWKIPSGEITNLPYLERISKTRKDVILSTGMCDMDEVEAAVRVLKDNGTKKLTILHCTTQYPTPYEAVNLNAMISLRDRFNCDVGYSDHTKGIVIPIAAVAMGATVIEKHFTLSREMDGPDHKASLEPDEMKKMIEGIREVEISLGDGIKVPASTEIENRVVARKSIVASRDIKKGEIFTIENITTKRPGNGISPMLWYDVLGSISKKDYLEDDLIEL